MPCENESIASLCTFGAMTSSTIEIKTFPSGDTPATQLRHKELTPSEYCYRALIIFLMDIYQYMHGLPTVNFLSPEIKLRHSPQVGEMA